MKWIGWLVMVLGVGSCWGEASCYRTPAQAAVQVGELEGGGYRLVFVRVDSLGGRSWAGVKSCLYPERPVVLVRTEGGRAQLDAHLRSDEAGPKMGHSLSSLPDVVGGRTVRVVQMDAVVRIEMSGVAQASGWVGDRVWVRMLGPGDGGHLELAVIRSAGLLEVGR